MPWTFWACARGVLVVSVTVISGDTPGVPQERGGQVAHWRPSVPVSTCRSSRSDKASSSWASKSCATAVGRVETRRERTSSVRVSYSAQIGWARSAESRAEVIDHGGDQRATPDAAGHRGW